MNNKENMETTGKIAITNKTPARKGGSRAQSEIIKSSLLEKIRKMGIEELLGDDSPLTKTVMNACAEAFEKGGKVEITEEEIRIETPEQIVKATKQGVQVLLADQESEQIEEEWRIKEMGTITADKKGRISIKRAKKELGAKKQSLFVQETLDGGAKETIPFMILVDFEKVKCPRGYYPQRLKMDASGRISVGEFRVRRLRKVMGTKNSEKTSFSLYKINEDMVVYLPEGIGFEEDEIKKLFSPLTQNDS